MRTWRVPRVCHVCVVAISQRAPSSRCFPLDPKVAFTERTFDGAKVQTFTNKNPLRSGYA